MTIHRIDSDIEMELLAEFLIDVSGRALSAVWIFDQVSRPVFDGRRTIVDDLKGERFARDRSAVFVRWRDFETESADAAEGLSSCFFAV